MGCGIRGGPYRGDGRGEGWGRGRGEGGSQGDPCKHCGRLVYHNPNEGSVKKKPGAAKVGWGTYFHNATRGSYIVKQGKGKGSTTTLSYGPGRRFARAADAEKEATRIVGEA